ncbi:MAG TPA: beta-galactosidase, partial [Candidatus Lokiarchaeia archaeon]|nr:beta-galactosidase [Candidatus Lokiarchaeia archaeon]
YGFSLYIGGGWIIGAIAGFAGVIAYFREDPNQILPRRQFLRWSVVISLGIVACILIPSYIMIPLPVGHAQTAFLYPREDETVPNRNNTFYILPIWENLHIGDLVTDETEAKNLTDKLGPSGQYVKIGYSCSCWYVMELTNWTGSWEFNESLSLDYKLALSVAANLPVLFHMNGGNWGASGLNPNADIHTGPYYLWELWMNDTNVQWNQNNQSVPTTWPQAEPGLLNRMFTLSKDSQFFQLRENACRSAASVIAAFAKQYPDLFVGVSLDSEIHLSDYNSSAAQGNWRYDYNPLVIREFQDWLAQQYTTIDSFNSAFGQIRGKNATSFSDVDAPRVPDSTNAFWQLWTTFRIQFVQQNVDAEAQWIEEAGIPRDQIYTHQILSDEGDISADDVRCDPLSTTNITYGSAGVTRYGLISPSRFHDINEISPGNWGIFEFNLPSDHDYTLYTRMLRSMYESGCHVVCPYAWYEGTWPWLYQISNDTAFTTAIHDFVAAIENFPRGTAPGGLLSIVDRLSIAREILTQFWQNNLYLLLLPFLGGLLLTIVLRRKGKRADKVAQDMSE